MTSCILIRKHNCADRMSSFICCICLLLKRKGMSFLEVEMIQCFFFCVPASVQASLNISLSIVVSLLCSSAVQHSDVAEGIFTAAHSVKMS